MELELEAWDRWRMFGLFSPEDERRAGIGVGEHSLHWKVWAQQVSGSEAEDLLRGKILSSRATNCHLSHWQHERSTCTRTCILPDPSLGNRHGRTPLNGDTGRSPLTKHAVLPHLGMRRLVLEPTQRWTRHTFYLSL